jgi:hypothetical protein
MAVNTLLQSIIAWVRKGYPEGVPRQDYIPLLALLKRRMSEDELSEVARELAGSGPDVDASATIARAIASLIHEQPSPADIERVRERLRSTGWDPDGEPFPAE